jgi:molybdate transport system regulatory protein
MVKQVQSEHAEDTRDAQDMREIKLRVYAGDVIAMGPGKADLLDAINVSGSISGAGRALGMSYRRCWELVSIMNAQFIEPLVLSVKGGSHGGGAELSPLGNEVLKRYRAMERRAKKAIASDVAHMRLLLKQ